MRTQIPVTVTVDIGRLIENLDETDAAEVIKAIDLRRASCDFTLRILNNLIRSLKKDMTVEEIRRDLTELNN